MLTLSPQDISAVWLSLKVACSATLIATPFGIACGYFLAFGKTRGKAVIEGMISLPLVLPPVVVGYLLLLSFGSNGIIGKFLNLLGIQVVFSLTGAVIASAVVGFPLMVRSIRIGMEAVDQSYISVSRTLGAGWWDSFFTIVLPLSSRAIFSGMSLMFARNLGEFGATVILAGNIPGVTQTIPLAIYEYTAVPGGDRMALTLCLVSISLSFAILLVSEGINRKFKKG
ncbi:molybdate ABC transporter permease subunit [Desulfobacter latus]|uniref:Molybdenum transport system permease n=1 Tax=Desulfobacter latus TaxID=2292 RepID=A0A850SV22_9BACT|nr:molybdate ABC transporter permease subunit [Desulfobacter latus]NWH05214.1 molybdate ABC transporter permease subunit [Desulfobacter latus]